jgi:hypothetical protein
MEPQEYETEPAQPVLAERTPGAPRAAPNATKARGRDRGNLSRAVRPRTPGWRPAEAEVR